MKKWVRGPRGNRSGGLLLVVAAALLAGTPIRDACAQTAGPDRIRQTLEQARQLYEEIQPVARQLGDRNLVERLQQLRQQWVQANGHFQGRRYQLAERMAQRNLEQLRGLAITLRRLAQRLPYYARMAERNREMHQLLNRRLGPDAPAEIVRQLTLAADAMEKARTARQEGNLVLAYRFMEQAQSMLGQVLRHVDQTGLTREAVQLEIEETDRRMERLRASEQLTPEATEALQRANEIQLEAKRMLGSAQLRLAMARTLTARTAVRLAQRLMAGALTPDDAAAGIGHAEELLEIHAELASHPDELVRATYAQARRQVEEAQSHLQAGRIREAMEAAQAAAKLVLTAVRRAQGAIPPLPAEAAQLLTGTHA